MKSPVHPLNSAEWHARFPLAGDSPGWRFRVKETSPCVYLVEGGDRFGRLVSDHGTDPDGMLEQCQAQARSIQRALVTFPDNQSLYDSVNLLCRDLAAAGLPALSQQVSSAMAMGATSGEAFGALRQGLRSVREDPAINDAFRERISLFIQVINDALGGPGRA